MRRGQELLDVKIGDRGSSQILQNFERYNQGR